VLELGTGTGVGTAWITSALLPRTDVTVVSVEKDPGTAALAARGDWPGFVDLRCADALAVLGEAGEFNLIFADAQGGKWEGLDRTIAALAPHGLLVVDDMTATPQWDAGQRARQQQVRQTLLTSPLLTSVELDHGSGVILGSRRA
jgi:demethylmenaquinone methyltransferase/2-methoxy-6-polyprenyl-1,4-benzoquinol methylase